MDVAKAVLDKVLYWIVVVLFAFLLFVLVWQVFTRQVISSPSVWTEEASRMVFVWLGLFAAALVFGERGHIAVEFLARKFPESVQRLLSALVQVTVLLFVSIVMIWGGWQAAENAWGQQLSALPFSFGQMYLALPVSGVLIIFYSLYYIVQVLAKHADPYETVGDSDPLAATPDVQEDKLKADSLLIDTSEGTTAPSPEGDEDNDDSGKKDA